MSLNRLNELHDHLVEASRLIPVSGVGTYGPLMDQVSTAIGTTKELIHQEAWGKERTPDDR